MKCSSKKTAGIERAQFCQFQILHFTARAGRAIHCEIVEDNHMPIDGQLGIELNGIGFLAHRQVKGNQGVFRRICTGAAMGNDRWMWEGFEQHSAISNPNYMSTK
mgnify:CR=1 FL=1